MNATTKEQALIDAIRAIIPHGTAFAAIVFDGNHPDEAGELANGTYDVKVRLSADDLMYTHSIKFTPENDNGFEPMIDLDDLLHGFDFPYHIASAEQK